MAPPISSKSTGAPAAARAVTRPAPSPTPRPVETVAPKKAGWTPAAGKAAPAGAARPTTLPVTKAKAPATAASTAAALPPAPGATSDKASVYAVAQQALSTSLTDWAVTDADVKTVHTALEGLPMGDYKATLEQMDKAGLLEKYVDNMEPAARDAFLSQAHRKGYLGKLAGEKPETNKLDPPSTPGLYVQTPAVPKCVREAMHESNLSAVAGFDHAYRGYLQRYEGALEACPSGKAVRELGAPTDYPSEALREPGLEKSNPQYRAFLDDWTSHARNQPTQAQAWLKVGEKMTELTGETRPGSFWLKAEVEIVTKPKGASGQLGSERGPHVKGGVEVRKGYEASLGGRGLETGSKSVVGAYAEGGGGKGKAKVEVSTRAELTSKGEVDKVVSADVSGPGGMGVGVEASSNGDRELSIKLNEHLGSYSKGNAIEGTLEGGVTGKVPIDDESEAEFKAGIGMKAISQKEVRVAIAPNNPGAMNAPRELEEGVPWDALPENRREIFEANAWTKAEWDAKLPARR